MSYLRKLAGGGGDGKGRPKIAAADLKSFPAIVEYCSSEKYPDGKPRQTATLSIFFDSGSWKACLNDRDTEETAWYASTTLHDLLDGLEKALQAGEVDWRTKRPWKGPKK